MPTYSIKASDVDVRPINGHQVDLSFTASLADVLDCFTLDEVIDYFGSPDLLEAIGKEEAANYFDTPMSTTNEKIIGYVNICGLEEFYAQFGEAILYPEGELTEDEIADIAERKQANPDYDFKLVPVYMKVSDD
jgi:hypothetical protein